MTQTDSGGRSGAGGATGAAAVPEAAGSTSPEAAVGGQARVPSGQAPEPSSAPREELRLAVVLNGGVSLAVWMGGASLELHRLAQGAGVYGALLQLAGCRARIDVIAGTSAGGINGAALALAQANRKARLADLRDIWTDQGQIDTLLRRPFRGSPTSLLQGDEYFLPRLNEAMQRLVTPFEGTSPEDHPLDLTITTTLLRGAQKVSVDSSGQRLPQWVHEGRFRFARSGASAEDPFDSARITATADQLALAARCTASFPVAFEPSFVPVDRGPGAETAEDLLRLRPDMGAVASWASGNRDEPGWVAVDPEARFDVSRFAVDGGLLANMPTRAALDAVDTMEASGPVRRVMLLVHPHAPAEQRETADDPEEPPSLTGSMVSILGALSAQGSRTFVEQVEQHNITAAGRRGTRADILATIDTPARLQSLAGAVFEQYRRLRMWRAGRDVAVFVAPQEGWNTERIRRNARRAQEAWYAARQASGDARQPLPYVPSGVKAQAPNGWGWGVSTAVGVADAAADLLRRLVWVLPHGADYDKVSAARRRVSQLRHDIRGSRILTDRMWQADPVLRGLEPTQTLFTLRLAWYEWAMLGAPDPQQLRALRSDISDLIDRVADHEAARVEPGPTAQARVELVRGTLHHRLLGEGVGGPLAAVDAGAIGEQVRSLVDQVVAEIRDVQPLLAGRNSSLRSDLDAELAPWARILGRRNGNGQLLQVLLALEVATTALGDENPTEYSLPLELVQLSAQAPNGFATATRTADDKLGGMSISRFGGFLKRSWRLNDWAWGRMDAATVLCRLILEPSRLRRTAGLSGRVGGETDPEALAEDVLAALIPELFGPLGDEAPPINDFDGLRAAAKAELAEVFSDRPIGDLPPTMPKLAELAAWAAHMRAITEELPALGRAVRADSLAGANPRSNGELLVAEHADLISRLEELASQAGGGELPPFTTASMHDAVTALRAFDRAGVGRESLREEGTSDQLIRTATSAAAVAATVVDSDDSGLAAVKPVTRSLRGGMLLPYWAVAALTAGGVLSRALALLGLSIGAVLLVLALFGALPAWASGVGAAFGTSALLVAFAYGALRTGTMLHGVVLLSPVIPLLAFAVERVRVGSAETSAAQGVATLLAVVALALGLMVLGSLPAPVLSVYGEIDQAGDRMGIPPVPLDLKGSRLAMAQAGRRVRTVLQMLVRPLGTVAAVGVGAAAILLAVNTGAWVDLADWVGEHRTQALIAAVAVALVGLLVAWRQGESLRVAFDASEALSREIPVWRFHPVRHPAGVVVGWASLYGMAYLVIAGLLLWDPWDWLDTWWGKALLVTALLFAVVLLLVLPVILPWRATRRVEHAEEAYVYEQLRLGRAAGLVDIRGLTLTRRGRQLARSIGETIQPDGRGEHALRAENQQRLLRDLVERGQAYRFLVKTSSKTAEDWYPSAWGADSTTLTVVEH